MRSTPAQHNSHRRRDVALELGLRHARRLKILPVEIGDAVVPQGFERQASSAVLVAPSGLARLVPPLDPHSVDAGADRTVIVASLDLSDGGALRADPGEQGNEPGTALTQSREAPGGRR